MRKMLLFFCLACYLNPFADMTDRRNKSLGGRLSVIVPKRDLSTLCEDFAKEYGAGEAGRKRRLVPSDC